MRRIRIFVAYDGTNYCGWQIQPNGITIEEKLNKALNRLTGEDIRVIGASRTDSGVHALGNAAVFDTESPIPPERFSYALNQRLPEDVVVVKSDEVPLDWHPRYQDNISKTYEYHIYNAQMPNPLKTRYCTFVSFPLDIGAMREGAKYLIGAHDFVSFCNIRTNTQDTVRTVYDLTIEKKGDEIVLRITGNGFLYNMVRIIMGTLVKIGMGVWPPERMEEILEARDRAAAGPTIPARGLTLVSMEYEREPKEFVSGENRHWSYILDQRRMLSEGFSVLEVLRCEEKELEGVLRRVIHQAVRNGAQDVYVKAKGRIHPGDQFGYYMLKEPDERGKALGDGCLMAVYKDAPESAAGRGMVRS